MDKDLAATTIEPLVARIVDQLASDMGLERLRQRLPIDVGVTITLRSGERALARATMASRVKYLEA